MYCTGGIRCDIYSTFLKSKGYHNLYTLEGGIQNYLKEEGPDLWNGSLYVFDGRMAIAADQRDPVAAARAAAGVDGVERAPLTAAVPCQVGCAKLSPMIQYAGVHGLILWRSFHVVWPVLSSWETEPAGTIKLRSQVCGAAAAELPHVNCANIDCNELFIACSSCKARLRGCCCEACTNAPRLLRPAKLDGGNYGTQ
jgi:predicted sulfurtransferase